MVHEALLQESCEFRQYFPDVLIHVFGLCISSRILPSTHCPLRIDHVSRKSNWLRSRKTGRSGIPKPGCSKCQSPSTRIGLLMAVKRSADRRSQRDREAKPHACTSLFGLEAPLPNLAHRSSRVCVWKQSSQVCFWKGAGKQSADDAVTLASGVFQTSPVHDRDNSTTLRDQPGSLKRARDNAHRGTLHSQHD
jgi:hypothetical protein